MILQIPPNYSSLLSFTVNLYKYYANTLHLSNVCFYLTVHLYLVLFEKIQTITLTKHCCGILVKTAFMVACKYQEHHVPSIKFLARSKPYRCKVAELLTNEVTLLQKLNFSIAVKTVEHYRYATLLACKQLGIQQIVTIDEKSNIILTQLIELPTIVGKYNVSSIGISSVFVTLHSSDRKKLLRYFEGVPLGLLSLCNASNL